MTTPRKPAAYLTEGDCFMFALEKKHLPQTEVSNNTCRYLVTVAGQVDAIEFSRKINVNNDIRWLAALRPEKPFPLGIPRWTTVSPGADVPVRSHHTDEFLPAEILDRRIGIDQPPLLTFDMVYRPNGNTTIILSWHHLLMDGHGAILLLKQIAPDLAATSPYIYDRGKPQLLGVKSFWQAARAKFFVDRISRKPLSGFMDLKRTASRKQKIHVISFTKAETDAFDQIAPPLGARFGRSPFYLACATRTVYALLEKKGITVSDFWIPVPRNQRKKGAKGPVLGNHLAFLFYRIKAADMVTLADTVRSINKQTVEQIRSGMDKAYDLLTRYLRRTPLPLYYFWIKGPKGTSLASFLFTVAADHPDDLASFDGHPVVEALSLPSNISPPGLTFAFMHFHGSLRLMVLYFEGLLTEHELAELEKQIRHELTLGTAYRDGTT